MRWRVWQDKETRRIYLQCDDNEPFDITCEINQLVKDRKRLLNARARRI